MSPVSGRTLPLTPSAYSKHANTCFGVPNFSYRRSSDKMGLPRPKVALLLVLYVLLFIASLAFPSCLYFEQKFSSQVIFFDFLFIPSPSKACTVYYLSMFANKSL